MSRIAVFFAEGFEEIESLTVIDLCRRAGMEAEMVSVTGQKTVTGSHRITIETDKLIEDADFSEYDMLVLPGGMPGTKNLEACIMLMKQLDTFYVAGKQSAPFAQHRVFSGTGVI